MTTRHNLTSADNLYRGKGYFAPMFDDNRQRGAPVNFLSILSLGSPIALDANGLINAATSTELPNTETVTYTTADDGSSPFDNAATPAPASVTMADGVAYSVWTLDVARNITAAVTHGSSVVAMTIVVTGFDAWGVAVSETLTIAATGTSQSAAGKKAFKHVYSIAITAAADAEANTLNLGWGDVLGLSYKLSNKADVIAFFNGAQDTAPTVVAAVTTSPATATTGDVRGTIVPGSACDGSEVRVWMHITDPNTTNGLKGVDQYGG